MSLVFMANLRAIAPIALAAATLGAMELSDADRFRALLEEDWSFRLEHDPLLATNVGEHRWDDRLPAVTHEAIARREHHERELASRLATISRERLTGEDRVSHDVLSAELRHALEAQRFRTYRLPINADSGFHTELQQLPKVAPLETPAQYDAYLSRLRAFPTYFQQQIAMLREGLKDGFTVPRWALEGYERTASAHVVDVEKSVFYAPFTKLPAAFSEAEKRRIVEAGRAAVRDAVIPSFRTFAEFLTQEYLPGSRRTTGASDLPDGPAFYAHLVRRYTTLDLTPEKVQELGLSEVARIHAEMDEVIRQVGWTRGFAAFLEYLRTDPRFQPTSPAQLLKEAAWIAKRMDGKLPSLFRRLPRQPYGVAPVPDEIAAKYTGGRYVDAPLDSREAGTYWVNTSNLPMRTLYTLEALTLHEAVPGHHLQIALARELTGIPPFRRFSYIDAFGEGWGLYAERLGLEAGFYTDPYSNFGRLTYEMWRACRLVVDPGLHAFGWGRQKAIDYLAANTALSLHECTTETDRYISWPGQALAYKLGELKIRELRARAERQLGERFDLREFHDVVLGSGSLPLSVLEAKVDSWIAAEKKR